VPTWLDVCSLLGRVVFNYYECRRRHVTSSYLTRRICRRRRRRRRRGRPAVGGRRFADGSCYSGCTRCHGNDCRERRPAFVGQLSRSRAGLLECIHDTDLPHTHTYTHHQGRILVFGTPSWARHNYGAHILLHYFVTM